MRIGILHQASRTDGGVYQYSLSVIEALARNGPEHQYTVITAGNDDAAALNRSVDAISPPAAGPLFGGLRSLYSAALERLPVPLPLLVPFRLTTLGRWSRRQNMTEELGLDLLVCPVPTAAAARMEVPYVMAVHDLMHRYRTTERHPWKERTFRDFTYERGAEGSLLTVVSSEASKRDLHRFYGIPPDKIRTVPESVPPYVREYGALPASEVEFTLRRFRLPERYVFYPAQFWRHKNHANLVRALYRIKRDHGVEVPAVFVGAPKNAFAEVMSLIDRLGLSGQVTYLGYVSDREIVALYRRAVALVMPSSFNVSSIPVVEALVLGTPCVCADADPLPMQVGDAGLLFDPNDAEDIADRVWSVWRDEDLRRDLVRRGRAQAEAEYAPEVFARRWRDVVREAIDMSGGPAAESEKSGALAEARR